MILVDANLLLHAYDESSEHHADARVWWEARLSEPEPVRLAWLTVVAFVRIGTHPRVFAAPLSLGEAREHVTAWLGRPMVGLLHPTARHWGIFARMLEQAQATGNLVTDAHLAALAVEHGATLCSSDQDFSRFDGLSWRNPLDQPPGERA